MLLCQGRRINLNRSRPFIMGIVNITEDSFCGDGSLFEEEILQNTIMQLNSGADIIDVGAESARTNRSPISIKEEVLRFQKFFSIWQKALESFQAWDNEQLNLPLLSINTWREEVIAEILSLGQVDIVNDISGLSSPRIAQLCAENKMALCIMHNVREVKTSAEDIIWSQGVWKELNRFFQEKIELALKNGLSAESLILDPGIGFCKKPEDDLSIYNRLTELKKFHLPLLLPVSRKHIVGHVLDLWGHPKERDFGTLACALLAWENGGHIFRVHNVEGFAQAFKLLSAIKKIKNSEES